MPFRQPGDVLGRHGVETSQKLAEAERKAKQKLEKLTRLVNESLKYPGHETPERAAYDRIDSDYRGRTVPFGRYLAAGQGSYGKRCHSHLR